MSFKKLVLGTAQLGSDYGIAYTSRKITKLEFASIMHASSNKGVSCIDTAVAYGDSHKILGHIGISDWNITTKLPPVPLDINKIEKWYRDVIAYSLKDLRISKIDTLLLHRSGDLVGSVGYKLQRLLERSREEGEVSKIGVSIYTPDELSDVYATFRPDVVQCPYNIFDQRILTSGWLDTLANDGVSVCARSVFLQGILLKEISELNPYFNPWLERFSKFETFCSESGITKLEAALKFVTNEKKIAQVIVGVEGVDQINQILDAYEVTSNIIFDGSCPDIGLVNPLMWDIAKV